MNLVKSVLNNFLKDESGQDLIEYALIAGLIGLSCVASMSTLATNLGTTFSNLGTTLTGAV